MENNKQIRYAVTKTFTSGLLKGLTIVENTTMRFAVGFVCDQPVAGSPYRIEAVKVLQ